MQAMKFSHGRMRQVLVTKQTGPAGKPVNTLYIAKKMKLANEMYFAILLDRASAGPMIIACSEGDATVFLLWCWIFACQDTESRDCCGNHSS